MISSKLIEVSRGKRLVYLAPVIVIALFLLAVPFALDTAIISLVTKILCYSLLAMSVDIAFGYTGMWTFGHAAIFGVAAYADAILTKSTDLNFWLIAFFSILMAATVSAIFAAVSIRSSGLYFLLITFALGQLIYSMAATIRQYTNGHDGLWGISYPNIGFTFSSTTYYYAVLVIVVICAIVLFLFIRSPFGYSLIGIRDNEVRARTMGYNTRLRKFIAFVISGIFAGIAGVLYLHFNGGINPLDVGVSASGSATIMVIVGGTATLWGGFIGAGIILLLQFFISLFTPDRWPIYLGVIFIGAVFFARGGVFPKLVNLWKRVTGYGNTQG
jgi:branched-chain amino acid transport system permease protein